MDGLKTLIYVYSLHLRMMYFDLYLTVLISHSIPYHFSSTTVFLLLAAQLYSFH